MTKNETPAARETAILAGGCFWCLEAVFKEVDGVESVTSGYIGGRVEAPTYRQVCDGGTGHAEAVQIVFDPAVVSYRDLLDIFFVIHDPTSLNRQGNDIGTQYRSAIFAMSDEQLHTALDLIEHMGEARVYPSAIVTKVERAGTFWPAEPYHHDYYANNSDQPYCQYIVAPKISKFREKFASRRRRGG
ncbi:Peptide methionine sulfoxide reductase MsrA [Azoarcus sp. Aa7]|nr:Peptide methionine sulfoxide reductase MsrA [Azoarcus sp. Aa7]